MSKTKTALAILCFAWCVKKIWDWNKSRRINNFNNRYKRTINARSAVVNIPSSSHEPYIIRRTATPVSYPTNTVGTRTINTDNHNIVRKTLTSRTTSNLSGKTAINTTLPPSNIVHNNPVTGTTSNLNNVRTNPVIDISRNNNTIRTTTDTESANISNIGYRNNIADTSRVSGNNIGNSTVYTNTTGTSKSSNATSKFTINTRAISPDDTGEPLLRHGRSNQTRYGNRNHDNGLASVHGRGKSSGRGRRRSRSRGRYRNRDNSDERDNGPREFQIPTSEVKMPSGKIVSVTIPAKTKCYCKKLSATVLIPLGPKSRRPSPDFKIITDEMNSTIRYHATGSFSNYEVISVHKIKNCCLWTKFRNRQIDMEKEEIDVNQRMLFHGSAAVNDIVHMGFDERHSNQSGMFGAGIYFARHSSKSNQYVFGYLGRMGCTKHKDGHCYQCVRKMLLCRVSLGKIQRLTTASKMAHAPPGYHSVAGEPTTAGLMYPEFVVYRGEQAYPEYLITYKIVR